MEMEASEETGRHRLLTPAEAAEELGVSRQFVYKLATLGPERGGIAAVRLGGLVRIPRSEIERVIEFGTEPMSQAK